MAISSSTLDPQLVTILSSIQNMIKSTDDNVDLNLTGNFIDLMKNDEYAEPISLYVYTILDSLQLIFLDFITSKPLSIPTDKCNIKTIPSKFNIKSSTTGIGFISADLENPMGGTPSCTEFPAISWGSTINFQIQTSYTLHDDNGFSMFFVFHKTS